MAGLKDELPWESISAQVLEELIYSLVGEMGATEREWRSSPGVINTADGGRDIEAVFMFPTAGGELKRQCWWIDAKRRKKAVSPTDVKEVAYNSITATNVDEFIIASNSSFSNPTRDWVKKFNADGHGPTLRLWDRVKLQELVDRHPAAAAATFFEALGVQDRIEYLSSYFFRKGRVLTEDDLEWAWSVREEVVEASLLVAAVYAEISLGDISLRPWGALLSPLSGLHALVFSHSSLVISAVRNPAISLDKCLEVAAYITAQACRLLPAKIVADVLSKPFHYLEGGDESLPSRHFTEPALMRILGELLDVCGDDCARVSVVSRIIFKDDKLKDYWIRYRAPIEDEEVDRGSLIIETPGVPCAVGFQLGEEERCPLMVKKAVDYEKIADIVKRVIEFRVDNPSGQYLKYSDIAMERLGGGRGELQEIVEATLGDPK